MVEYAPVSQVPARKPVVVVPPFGEEMNRSRRMLACQGRALAAAGHRMIVFDFSGTGDSAGEFADCDLPTWQRNTMDIIEWTAGREDQTFGILAVRFGALLLPGLRPNLLGRAADIVLWQPVTDGKTWLRQFLRLRIAANMGTDLEGTETTASLLDQLEGGEALEIGGYELSGDLAAAIGQSRFEFNGNTKVPPTAWFDIVAGSATSVSPAAARKVASLAEQGVDVTASVIADESFWTTVETTIAPKLLDVTTSVFAAGG